MAIDDFVQQVALVSQVNSISFQEVRHVAAALDKQAQRDLRKFWKVLGTVQPFDDLNEVPPGTWPIIVVADVKGAAGIHLDEQGQPFAVCEAGSDWSLTASHELLEMLVDPWGNRLIPGPSLKSDQGRVEYLVEVCDPSEAREFAYRIGTDNQQGLKSDSVLVSDFYTPEFFDPVQAHGVRYSFTGAILGPRQIRQGGYISWRNPLTDEWWQQTWFSSDAPQFRNIGKLTKQPGENLRRSVQNKTPEQQQVLRASRRQLPSVTSRSKEETHKARAWRAQLNALGIEQTEKTQ